jgi:hypothetical protein
VRTASGKGCISNLGKKYVTLRTTEFTQGAVHPVQFEARETATLNVMWGRYIRDRFSEIHESTTPPLFPENIVGDRESQAADGTLRIDPVPGSEEPQARFLNNIVDVVLTKAPTS